MEPRLTLAEFLREIAGSRHPPRLRARVCGACTVLVDGEACGLLMFAVQADGPGTTIEGFAADDGGRRVQARSRDAHGLA